MIPTWIGLFLLPFVLLGNEQESRLEALLELGDYALAKQEVSSVLSQSQTPNLYKLAIKIFARAGEEDAMLSAFRNYQTVSESPWPRDVLEEMAWGMIEKGSKQPAPETRAMALIAAGMGNDARGVDILLKNSGDSHRLIRALVVEFASHFRDEALQEMIAERLKLEKDPEVRIALLQAAGAMKIDALEKELVKILENERSLPQEKAAAIVSLVDLKEKPERAEIQKLMQSPRAALRLYAARLIELNEEIELLSPLLVDSHAEVRKGAWEVLGALRPQDISSYTFTDSNPEVAIVQASVLMLYDTDKGHASMQNWLKSSHPDERLKASLALKGAGKYGFPLTLTTFKETEDPLVKLNLAVTLVQEDCERDLGLAAIYQTVIHHEGRLMETELGHFSGIGPCTLTHRADIPHYPEAVNQMTRLELLNLLAVHKHPQANEAILHFLKGRPWGITGAASALLLTEGEEETLVLIRALLKDPSEKIQLQAALILALWGTDPEAIATLEKLYGKVSFDKKGQILEALGRIGDFSTVPFLVERLEEPQWALKVIASAALLQTLYH